MHWLWFFFLEKRQFSWLLIVSLIGLGVYAVFAIPKESAPEVVVPIGVVTTVYPGATAGDIEELITNKLEDDIENVDNLENLTSVSRDDVSIITAEFSASADIDKSIQDLKDAVDNAKGELPRDANDPSVIKVDFANDPIHVISISSPLSPVEFTELGERLANEFESVRGVGGVSIAGTRERQVRVVVDQSSLATYGVSVSEVSQALALGNLSMPVGTVSTEGIEYSVRLEGKLTELAEIQNVPIKSVHGTPVYIRDVADVAESVDKEQTISRVSVGGQPSEAAMTVSVFKKAGFDVTEMSAGVHEKLEELQSEGGMLEDSQVLIVFDQGDQVKKDLTELVHVGFETVALVVLCLLVTIGWRESLVAALSIPLSFVIAFIGLYASGNTINFVSLFALILAVGILVDSGIVITEAIHTRMRKFGDPDTAAKQAIVEYAWPLIAGTLTTVAVFAPLFFLSGIIGEFIASIPFTIIFVLLASIFVALGMVPLIAIYLTKHSSSNRFEEVQEEYTHKAQAWYRNRLVAFLQNRKQQRIFLWTLFIAFVASLALPVLGLMNVIFFPPEDVDFVFVEVETKQGTPVGETDLAVRAVEDVLYEKDYIKAFSTTAGAGSSFTGSTNAGGKFASISVTLNEERELSSEEIAADLRGAFDHVKDAKVTVSSLNTGPPTGAPVFVKFTGDDLEELIRVAEDAESLIASIAGTRDVAASTKSNATEFVLSIDRAKANAAGVSPAAVGETLRAAVFGVTATTINRDGDDVDVIVKLDIDRANDDSSATPEITIEALRNLEVQTFSGQTILLGSVLNEKLTSANAAIDHEDKKRLVSVSAYTEDGTTATEVLAEFRGRTGELKLPEGIEISYGGEAEDINQSFTEMFIALIVGLLLMLAILVLCFNSIRYSLYLLLAVPYSLIGVMFGLTATGLALSFTSLLGVIALAGVIINHAIILMDSMITHKASAGTTSSLIDQVADAAVSRLRPIFLTTVTTVIGMIPLSTISDFWSPLAFAIMFGLTFAMILTLILVPTLYYRAEKKKLEKQRAKAIA